MKIKQISACIGRSGEHYLYVLLEDGRIFRRQKPPLVGKDWAKPWIWVEIQGLDELEGK